MTRERDYYTQRTLCDVLYEITTYLKTMKPFQNPDRKLDVVFSLLEEVQIIANRLEAGLGEKRDLRELNEEWHNLRREVMKLRKEKKNLAP